MSDVIGRRALLDSKAGRPSGSRWPRVLDVSAKRTWYQIPFAGGAVLAMALNIKDEAAIAELRRLSELTGQSMSKEIVVSVHERLQRVEAAGDQKLERLMRLAESSAKLWPDDMRPGDPSAGLYDDHGMPA